MIRGFARSYEGVGAKANRGFYYLNPFLSTSRRVFGELNSDQANLEGLVVDAAGAHLDTLDQKSPEISSLVVAKHAHKKNLTLKEAGLELGLIDEATFDRVVKPDKMIGR